MKIIQYKGPFAANEIITVKAMINYKYVHIGIQIPEQTPLNIISKQKNNPIIPIDLTINDVNYRISDTGILEFCDLSKINWNIQFKRDMPAETIIDIAYYESEK